MIKPTGVPAGEQTIDPLFSESACQHASTILTPPPDMQVECAPVVNSKPLLVSELVSNYKAINTSTLSEQNHDRQNQLQSEPGLSNKIVTEFADMPVNRTDDIEPRNKAEATG